MTIFDGLIDGLLRSCQVGVDVAGVLTVLVSFSFIQFVLISNFLFPTYQDWTTSKWHPVLKVWEQPQAKHSKVMQNSYGLALKSF